MSRARFRIARYAGLTLVALTVLLLGSLPATADTTAQPLPFAQDWADTGLITANDDWSGVPGVIGYRGDGLVASPGADPQTITADGSGTPVDVNANLTNPNTFTTGGLAEFELADPVVALQGSGTADAPHLALTLDTTGHTDITVAYDLRDVDGSADNAVQQVALQYRVGAAGSYTNLPAGYVADATSGPNLATQVTPVVVALPADAGNQPLVQLRVITADATGSDEWVGVDDISVTAGDVPPPDAAPTVTETSPDNGAADVPTDANVELTFSEPVTVNSAAFSISCTSSGAHTFALGGASTTYTLDPDASFDNDETCTVTVDDEGVSDVDADDPPDHMASDFVFSFSTVAPTRRIYELQGAGHVSPFAGRNASHVPGVVTAVRSNGFNMQDATGDGNPATSDGIFVFTGSAPTVAVGDAVLVSGRVQEFRPGGDANNLTTTELANPVVTPDGAGPPIAPTVIGVGGRVPPTSVIEDDASGDVEAGGVFDPAQDGLDFYESLEGMLVQIDDGVAVGPTNAFGEIPVLADNGAGAGLRTKRDGIVIRPTDFNPERLILDDVIAPTPQVDVGDRLPGTTRAVVDYSFGNFKFLVTSTPAVAAGGLEQEVADDPKPHDLSIATFNVENLDLSDGPPKFAELADLIVDNLHSPDVIAVEEVQDNNGPVDDSTTDASVTWRNLILTIDAVGGPVYDYRQIDPVDDQDGGEPGGNIRVGFLFRTDRPLTFVDRPGATPTTPNEVVETSNGAELRYSPGRIDPGNPAFDDSRKPLAGEFVFRGRRVIVIANHFNSKGGDQPLFGRFQPPVQVSQTQRIAQAGVVRDFVNEIESADDQANVVVLGDLNDFQFSQPLQILKGAGLTPLIETLPERERYSYDFDGNSQALDHILLNDELSRRPFDYDVVHVNAEFHDHVSDHDPQVAELDPRGRSS